VLPERPLVALDRHSAVLANRHGACPTPLLRALSHQFSTLRVNAPALLVAGQSGCCGDKPCLQAPEQQRLTTQVLDVEGGRGHG
jgi:hypothetical protein